MVIDYKAGAGTVIGVDFVAKSPPDGHTIGMVNSAFAVNATLRKKMPYDTARDLAGVTQLANLIKLGIEVSARMTAGEASDLYQERKAEELRARSIAL